MAAFDGDTGERMFKGSKVEVIDGIRQPTTHHINDLQELERIVRHDGPWPWMMMGIFPAEGTEQPKAWWNWFCYTAGLSPEMELWAPCCSIEGRAAGNDLIGMVLNHIASGVVLGMVQPGDTVIVPLGVADDEDAGDVNSIWWIGDLVHGTQRHMVNMSAAQFVLPVQWSSPLGWEEP
jgi:hypothetical protein